MSRAFCMSNGTEIPSGDYGYGSHSISFASAPFVELRQSLPSKVAAISPFTKQLMRFILNFRMADGSETDIEMALLEASKDV